MNDLTMWTWLIGCYGALVGGYNSFSAPFLAVEFKKRDIDVEYAGFVFSMYPIGRLLSSLI